MKHNNKALFDNLTLLSLAYLTKKERKKVAPILSAALMRGLKDMRLTAMERASLFTAFGGAR